MYVPVVDGIWTEGGSWRTSLGFLLLLLLVCVPFLGFRFGSVVLIKSVDFNGRGTSFVTGKMGVGLQDLKMTMRK